MVFVFDEIGDGKYGYKIYFIDFNDGELVYKLVSKVNCFCINIGMYILIVRIMVYIFDKLGFFKICNIFIYFIFVIDLYIC